MWNFSHSSDEIEDLIREDYLSDTVMQQFEKIETNSERLDFIYDLMKNRAKFNEIISKTKVPKCDVFSAKYREEGNQMFREGKYLEALQLYTQSIANANINSPDIALSYAQRSAVLLTKGYFMECLEDITRALENNCPEHLKESLQDLQKEVEDVKHTQIFRLPHDPTPFIKTEDKHLDIHAASNCLKINQNDRFGKHILATREIRVGDIIAIEKPYASYVEFESQFLHCHECLEYCVNMIPCKSCTSVLYCSPVCREQAFNSYHKYECNLMQIVTRSTLSIQIVLKAFIEKENQENVHPNHKHYSTRFKEINALQTNQKSRSLRNLYVHSAMASLCYYSLKNHTSFFNDISVSGKDIKDCLLHCEMITSTHQVEIEKRIPKELKLYDNLNKRDKNRIRIGRGLYSFSCLFSHSCIPNITYIHYGSVQVTKAIRDIHVREQCFINYDGISYATTHLRDRQLALQQSYYFDCRCKACELNWLCMECLTLEGRKIPTDFLKRLKMQRGFEMHWTIHTTETPQNLILDAVTLMYIFERNEPCKNFLRMQYVVNEIFHILGNRVVEF